MSTRAHEAEDERSRRRAARACCVSWSTSASSITRARSPRSSAICAACEPTARTIETASDRPVRPQEAEQARGRSCGRAGSRSTLPNLAAGLRVTSRAGRDRMGLPSESRQTAQRSPGCTISPPSCDHELQCRLEICDGESRGARRGRPGPGRARARRERKVPGARAWMPLPSPSFRPIEVGSEQALPEVLRAPEVVGGELDQRWGEIGHAQSLEPRAQPATSSSARVESPRFAGSFSQLLAPDGCGSGIDRRAVELEPRADALRELRQAEQPPRSRARRR